MWIDGDYSPVDCIPEGMVGFVYIIINLGNNRKYIGQKGFYSKVVRKPLKGKVRRRRSLKESDWKDYFGSNDELKGDVLIWGEDKFLRKIIRFCQSKAEMNYFEMKYQMENDVLLKDEYYNGYVGGRITSSMVKRLKDEY